MHLPRPVSMHPPHHPVYYIIYTRGNHHTQTLSIQTLYTYIACTEFSQWIIIVPESVCIEN